MNDAPTHEHRGTRMKTTTAFAHFSKHLTSHGVVKPAWLPSNPSRQVDARPTISSACGAVKAKEKKKEFMQSQLLLGEGSNFCRQDLNRGTLSLGCQFWVPNCLHLESLDETNGNGLSGASVRQVAGGRSSVELTLEQLSPW